MIFILRLYVQICVENILSTTLTAPRMTNKDKKRQYVVKKYVSQGIIQVY